MPVDRKSVEFKLSKVIEKSKRRGNYYAVIEWKYKSRKSPKLDQRKTLDGFTTEELRDDGTCNYNLTIY